MQMSAAKTIDTITTSNWLNSGKPVNILDIRPDQQRMEWHIPGSIHYNIYNRLQENDQSAVDSINLDKNIPIITVCAGGKLSLVAAGLLADKGYEAYSLDGGMNAWSLAWNEAAISFPDYTIIQFRRTGKGCLSYLIFSGNEALVVDASIDTAVFENYLKSINCKLVHVLETHIHADHLSRSKQLAENNSCLLHLPVPNKVAFNYIPVSDNTIINVGAIQLRAIKTPGHTVESMSYLVNNEVLLTGDTLLTRGVGRPDLKANTEEMQEKSLLLYQSLQKILQLNDSIIVLPAHSSEPIAFDRKIVSTTIGEARKNIHLLQLTATGFIQAILQNIPPTPANYLTIVERNLQGDFDGNNSTGLEAGANRCAVS